MFFSVLRSTESAIHAITDLTRKHGEFPATKLRAEDSKSAFEGMDLGSDCAWAASRKQSWVVQLAQAGRRFVPRTPSPLLRVWASEATVPGQLLANSHGWFRQPEGELLLLCTVSRPQDDCGHGVADT